MSEAEIGPEPTRWTGPIPVALHSRRHSTYLGFAGLAAAILALLVLTFVPLGLGTIYTASPPPPTATVAFIAVLATIMASFAMRVHTPICPASPAAWLALALLGVTLGAGFVASFGLHHFPNSGDEYAYLFQAWTYEAGRLSNPAPAFGSYVASSYTWIAHGKWVGQYPPGWPLLIALADNAGAPIWLLNVLLLGVTGLLLFDLVRREADARTGAIAAAVFLLSPFSLFQAASFFSHTAAAFLVTAAVWSARRAIQRDRAAFMLLAGAAIGALGVTRTSSAVIVALPLAALLLRRRPHFLLALGCGGAPFLAALLLYQQAITGSALKPVYYFGGRTADHLYFDPASIRFGLSVTVMRAIELCTWVSPLLLPLWVLALRKRIAVRRFDALDAVFPLAALIFVFYPFDGGNRYGPRYWFEFWPLILVTIGTALPAMSHRLRRFTNGAAFATLLYGLLLVPFLTRAYDPIIAEREEPYRLAKAMKLEHAVVCIADPSGTLASTPEDYARNGIAADGPVLYAHCNGATPAQVRAAFRGYRLFYYDRPAGKAAGRITPAVPG